MTGSSRTLILVALAACSADIDEPWQLAHDRIIAVRATPPRIAAGQRSTVDVLLGFDADPVAERAPDIATVVTPPALATAVAPEAGQWIITAPSDDQLDAARLELGLPAGAPVPLLVGVAVAWPHPVASSDGQHFGASKIVWLGEAADNPQLAGVLVNGQPPGDELVVPTQTKVPLHVDADDDTDIVTWLTSCGTMHDFDLHAAYLTVDPEDAQDGELVLVVRDQRGGVAWHRWPIRAE